MTIEWRLLRHSKIRTKKARNTFPKFCISLHKILRATKAGGGRTQYRTSALPMNHATIRRISAYKNRREKRADGPKEGLSRPLLLVCGVKGGKGVGGSRIPSASPFIFRREKIWSWQRILGTGSRRGTTGSQRSTRPSYHG